MWLRDFAITPRFLSFSLSDLRTLFVVAQPKMVGLTQCGPMVLPVSRAGTDPA